MAMNWLVIYLLVAFGFMLGSLQNIIVAIRAMGKFGVNVLGALLTYLLLSLAWPLTLALKLHVAFTADPRETSVGQRVTAPIAIEIAINGPGETGVFWDASELVTEHEVHALVFLNERKLLPETNPSAPLTRSHLGNLVMELAEADRERLHTELVFELGMPRPGRGDDYLFDALSQKEAQAT